MMKRRSLVPNRYFPIGLNRSEPYHWINALMQFILYFPTLREIFAYTPQSLHPFNEFIDRYFLDVEEKKSISQAKGDELISCLLGKFPHLFRLSGIANLHETIQALSQSAWALPSREAAAEFRPEWQLLWDPKREFCSESIFQKSVPALELLVGLQGLYDPVLRKNPQSLFCNTLEKQYYSTDLSASFELDAFIEHRAEEGDLGTYFTYLKIDGVWVQCADERIVVMRRSSALDVPLRRSILFHYRRMMTCRSYGMIR